jgi:hypothetical protein
MAEVSRKRALLEIDATRLLIECLIGRSTIMFRAPFNADSDPEKAEELVPVALEPHKKLYYHRRRHRSRRLAESRDPYIERRQHL